MEYILRADFQYRHQNPYHERLRDYEGFVWRDREAEQFSGRWNREVFKNDHPIAVEIGPGYGHFLLEYCRQNVQVNLVGIDYRFKRSFRLAKKIHRSGLANVRQLRARGERLHFIFGAGEVDRIFLFFPDPWPKTRHHKKRLLQAPLLDSIYQVLKPGGRFLIKTDHGQYAARMADHFQGDRRWSMELQTMDLHARHPGHFLSTYPTKFEKIFLSQGVSIKAFQLCKIERGEE